jgi:uncharacterized protein with NRDE domain
MKLKQFQKQDYARLALTPGGILAHDTGLGKTWAAYTWPLLKVGFTPLPGPIYRMRPSAPVLIVAPGDLHQQFIEEAALHFKAEVVRLSDQATFMRLSRLDPATGRRTLPAGYYITSYTQLGVNGVVPLPDASKDDPEYLMELTGTTLQSVIRGHNAAALAAKAPTWEALNGQGQLSALITQLQPIVASMTGEVGASRKGVRCVFSPSLADLCQDAFQVVVVDEAVRMKGKDTLIAQGVRQMSPPFRLVLTATPVKNRVPDLFWLAWWACGSQSQAHARWPYSPEEQEDFAKTFCVSERNLTKAAKAKAAGSRGGSRYKKLTPQVCNIHRIWKLMAPIILRRRKHDSGVEIVAKHRHVYRVPLGTKQAEVYKAHLEWKPTDKNGKTAIGAQLQALRMVAAAPNSLSLPRGRGHSYTPKLATVLTLTQQILERGEQVVIFSPFHDPLDTLSARLQSAGVNHSVLDGRVSQRGRGELAAAFKKGPTGGVPVILAGVECMSEGHSFPLCNNVILLAYPWALDKVLQCEDRAYRLNSVRDLNSYRIVCDGSIDRKMESQIGEKSDSAELVLDGHLLGDNASEMSLAELFQIAEREFENATKTVPETSLEAEWPALRDQLRRTASVWGGIQPPSPTPLPAPQAVQTIAPEPQVQLPGMHDPVSGWRNHYRRRLARSMAVS